MTLYQTRSLLKPLAIVVLLGLVSACEMVSVPEERDSGPDQPVDVSHIPDAVPRQELRTIAGNVSPYKVFGKTYHVLTQPETYRERGVASWYGKKFHGRKTSNGELYNMFGMTAAHKTLPIPSYVRVTNVSNNISVVVRVNDRGPFHGDRIIDLTYTAASKLGFASQGTTEVLVEYIDPRTYTPTGKVEIDTTQSDLMKAPAPLNSAGYALPENTFLQVGAFSQESSAYTLKERLLGLTNVGVVVVKPEKRGKKLYRVQVGPFSDNLTLMNFRQTLIDEKFPTPYIVYQ